MRSAQHLAVLRDIGKILFQEQPSVRALLRRVLRKANRLIGSNIAFIGLVEEDEAGHRWVVVRDKEHKIIGAQTGKWVSKVGRLKIGAAALPIAERSFVGYTAYLGKAKRTGDARAERYYRQSNPATRSELAVPIILDGAVLGVINLESRAPNFYTAAHQQILELVAALIARPLDSLLAREGGGQAKARTLHDLRDTLYSLPQGVRMEGTGVLSGAARIVADAMSSRSCTIWLLDEPHRTLILRGAWGPHRKHVDQHHQREADTLGWRALHQRAVLRFGPNYRRERTSGRYDREVYGRTLRSPLIISPLLSRGEPLGVIKVGLKRRTRYNPSGTFTNADEQRLHALENQIATAIALNRLDAQRHDIAAARAVQLRGLHELFACQPNLQSVLDCAVTTVPALVNGVDCSIFLWHSQKKAFVLAASHGLSPDLIGKASYRPGEGLTGWVGLHRKPLVLDDRAVHALQHVHPGLQWKGKYAEGGLAPKNMRRPFLAAPILGDEGRLRGVIRVSDRNEGLFGEADLQLLQIVAGHIAAADAYGRRYEERVQLLKELQRLTVLSHTLPYIDGGGDRFEGALLDAAIRSATEVLKVDILTLYRFDGDTGEFEAPPRWRGELRHPEFMVTPIHPESLPWKIQRDGSQYWDDMRDNSLLLRHLPSRNDLPAHPSFALREEVRAAAGVKLVLANRPVGVLFLSFRRQYHFGPDTREILETFGTHIAIGLEVERLYRQLKVSVSRGESNFLAFELHDGLLGVLYPLVLRAGKANEALSAKDYRAVGESLAFIEKAGKYCLTEGRAVMGLMATHAVDNLGFHGALNAYATEFCRGLPVTIRVRGHGSPPMMLQRHFYRICVTALTNVVKFAEATRVDITLDARGDTIHLTIEDDGQGFDPDAVLQQPGHYGLPGIRWRAEQLGGTLAVYSAPRRGSTLVVSVPVRRFHDETSEGEAVNARP